MSTGLGLAILGVWLPTVAAYMSTITPSGGVLLAMIISTVFTIVLLICN